MGEQRITLKEAVSAFLEDQKAKLTKQHFDNHFRTLFRLREHFGDNVVIPELISQIKKNKDIFNFLKEKYSLNNLYFSILQIRTFLKFCVKNGFIKDVDIDEVIDFKKYAEEYRKHFQTIMPEAIYPFDEHEMRWYWMNQSHNIISLRNAMVINILFDTGIKSEELLSITKENINFQEECIDLKSKNARIIKISNITSKLINTYLSQRKDKLPYLVISHSTNTISRLTSRSLERIVKYTSEKINSLIKIDPNTIRQSYSAKQFAEGKKRKHVKTLLGYSHYHVPQLNKFSLHTKAKDNKPDKNVKRYLEDFEFKGKLTADLNMSFEDMKKVTKSPSVERIYVSRMLLFRESQVINFLNDIELIYKDIIPVAVRQMEWGLSKDLFVKYSKVHPEKIKNIARIMYIDELVTEAGFISSLKMFNKTP